MSAAQAVTSALQDVAPSASASVVDALAGGRFPLTLFPRLYGPLVTNLPRIWLALWNASDRPSAADASGRVALPFLAQHLTDLLRAERPDVLVPIHPLLVRPAVRLAQPAGLPVACIATDLVRLHHFWLDPRVDLYLLSSEEAAQDARLAGVPPERIAVCGQPIQAGADGVGHAEAKEALGLERHAPLVVVSGGGAGAGPLLEVSEELDRHLDPETQLAVICGRNHRAQRRLETGSWRLPVRVFGYVSDMPLWLRAADVLVTKAGPSALAEAMAEGLPTVIMSALPGQETDNVRYFCQQDAAIWAPSPPQVRQEVAALLADPARSRALAQRARAAGRPDSARAAALSLVALATRARQDGRCQRTAEVLDIAGPPER